jgi:sulfatase modifying factor 1
MHATLFLLLSVLIGCGGQTETPLGSTGPGGGGSPSASSAFPSCKTPRPGADTLCGADGNLGCCDSLPVPGGTFLRDNNPDAPATISPFKLDRFEVTVGRFRAFVEAYPGSKPKIGQGAHPKIPGSGWRQEWDAYLPKTVEELSQSLLFIDEATLQPGYKKEDLIWMLPWTAQEGPNENLAVSNVTWPLAFAFCIWDGGRLPTEAEWTFAALGGEEQREHPWGDEPIDDTRSAFYNNVLKEKKLRTVGSALAGAARWGHLDLNGSNLELVLDGNSNPKFYITPCSDCALLDPDPDFGDFRRFKDYNYYPRERAAQHINKQATLLGVRCARD